MRAYLLSSLFVVANSFFGNDGEGFLNYFVIIPEEFADKSLTLGEWVQIFSRVGYNTFASISIVFFGLRFVIALFSFFKGKANFIGTGISRENAVQGAWGEIMTSVTGLILVVSGMIIIRIILYFFWPQYLWIFSW